MSERPLSQLATLLDDAILEIGVPKPRIPVVQKKLWAMRDLLEVQDKREARLQPSRRKGYTPKKRAAKRGTK